MLTSQVRRSRALSSRVLHHRFLEFAMTVPQSDWICLSVEYLGQQGWPVDSLARCSALIRQALAFATLDFDQKSFSLNVAHEIASGSFSTSSRIDSSHRYPLVNLLDYEMTTLVQFRIFHRIP